ncbi:MAG: sulfatase-like hydrolase/transferase, partial [Actinomycetota bacterium]
MKDYEGFRGRIGPTLADSEPAWPTRPHPGNDAPNVIVILFDDMGFSHLGCYGSTIDTPNIDRLAGQGLRFTNFHVTPHVRESRIEIGDRTHTDRVMIASGQERRASRRAHRCHVDVG